VYTQVTKWVSIEVFLVAASFCKFAPGYQLELNRVVSVAAAVVAFSKTYEAHKLRSYC
jgi:hypothetical protein